MVSLKRRAALLLAVALSLAVLTPLHISIIAFVVLWWSGQKMVAPNG